MDASPVVNVRRCYRCMKNIFIANAAHSAVFGSCFENLYRDIERNLIEIVRDPLKSSNADFDLYQFDKGVLDLRAFHVFLRASTDNYRDD